MKTVHVWVGILLPTVAVLVLGMLALFLYSQP